MCGRVWDVDAYVHEWTHKRLHIHTYTHTHTQKATMQRPLRCRAYTQLRWRKCRQISKCSPMLRRREQERRVSAFHRSRPHESSSVSSAPERAVILRYAGVRARESPDPSIPNSHQLYLTNRDTP
jgi:hypothetical protein